MVCAYLSQKLYNHAGVVTSSIKSVAMQKLLALVQNLGARKMSFSESTMKTKKRTCMEEEKSRVIVRISEDGIIIGDFIVMNYDELLHLIEQKECKIIFDSEDAFQNLKNGIEPYIEEIYCIQLATEIEKFIAEQYALQVSTNSL